MGTPPQKKREEAINFIQKQKSYFTKGEGKGQVHGAKFTIDEDNVGNIFAFLDLTTGWKTQKIRIDEDISNSSELRGALRCFCEKTSKSTSLDYCRRGDYNSEVIKSGCRVFYFHEFESEEWRDYGFINTTKGEWIFDRDRIREQIEKEIDRLKYCPLLNVKKVRNLIKKLPERINPKTHHGWAFISQDYNNWFWHMDRWLNTLGETNFPGFSLMVGVRKLRKKDMSEAVGYSELSDSRAVSYVQTRVTYPSVVSDYVSDDQKMMELIDSLGRLVEKSIIRKKLFKKKQDELMKLRRKTAKTLRKKKPNRRIVSAFATQVSVVKNLVSVVSQNENLSRKDIKKLKRTLK